MYSLPQELINLILSFIDPEDLKTVTQCHLVSRAFVPVVRSILFRKLAFRFPQHWDDSLSNPRHDICASFLALLLTDPFLGETIRHLEIQDSTSLQLLKDQRWHSLPVVIKELTNLKTVKISRVSHLNLRSSDSTLLHGIQLAISIPSVVCVSFSDINTNQTLEAFILSCFNLRTSRSIHTVEMEKISFNDLQIGMPSLSASGEESDAPLKIYNMKTQLPVRTCMYVVQLISFGRSTLDFTALQSLGLTLTLRYCLGILEQALTFMDGLLESLEITFTGFTDRECFFFHVKSSL
jgi:hypothetical protein